MSIQKYYIIIFIMISFLPIFAEQSNLQAEQDSTKVDNERKHNLSLALDKATKYQQTDKYKIFLDFKYLTYYNLRRKIYKNIIFNLSNQESTNDTSNINSMVNFPELNKNKKKLVLNNLKEFNESQENLQKLISFLLKQNVYNSNGLKKGELIWPGIGRIISEFGESKKNFNNFNFFENGIKIKVESGEKIKAVEKGIIKYADWLYGFGRVIIIDHGNAYYTVYGYLSEILIELNNTVEKGQAIGNVVDSGTPAGPCLYFEIRDNGKSENPKDWLMKNKE